ncbi:MAG TPA: SDR family NAD(P)-dependent oxidoreductase [Candidatus Acidoferrales bacterium]|nr:SDR family NAD(P)-dependent oxidoreductase [Candidatus Acidoferrales bacterium]
MRMKGNTIFITGGSSGIGKGLAEAFHKLGNQVIIAGRREDRMLGICDANPGMKYWFLDVTDRASIQKVAAEVIDEFPGLNCVINNAGLQKVHNLVGEPPLDDAGMMEEISANLVGAIRVAAAFVPHLSKAKEAVLVNVSSGLAFVPLARYPVYCATKAAVHSFTLSLRYQLNGVGVKVIELIPPFVRTELGGEWKYAEVERRGAPPPMPLDEFISEAMSELAGDADEVAVGESKKMLGATSLDTVKRVFAGMNH